MGIPSMCEISSALPTSRYLSQQKAGSQTGHVTEVAYVPSRMSLVCIECQASPTNWVWYLDRYRQT
jgi:hypothetical protein